MPEDPRFDSYVYPVVCKPGIKRDGTSLDGNYYSDGEWVRFRLGRPKKMGGYREIVNGLNGVVRSIYVHSKHPEQLIFTFSGEGIEVTAVDTEGVGGSTIDRTPVGFAVDDYLWQVDAMYDSTGSPAVKVIAHAGDNLHDGDENAALPVYYGDADGVAPLTSIGESVSGGIVVLQPYLFIYGSDGLIKNSIANDPATFTGGDSNTANVSGSKIVRGLPLRGGSNAPAGLFWSLTSLIRVSFVGGTAKWRYDTLSEKSTILSSNGVIDYDGVFYWAGVDRFLMYNGVIKEVPNQMNQDFFFDNLNFARKQKVWVTALPRWGEIWWFFPKGDSEECNHAVIYNVREGSWYDTPINRSAGYAPRVLYFPIWAEAESNDVVDTDKYRIYRHETGSDSVQGEDQTAIMSFFETSDIGFVSGGPSGEGVQNPNVQTRMVRVEPDFNMNNQMVATVTGNAQAQSPAEDGQAKEFGATTPHVDLPAQRRLLRLRFSSNVVGGDYHMGKVLVHMEPGDQRQ